MSKWNLGTFYFFIVISYIQGNIRGQGDSLKDKTRFNNLYLFAFLNYSFMQIINSSSRNDSEMRRWVMITTMNKRINSPIRPCPFPRYTKLDVIKNSEVLKHDEIRNTKKIDKEFLKEILLSREA